MRHPHLMIDIETMGTRFDAPVLAIGAVFFDPNTGVLGAEFYRAIDIHDAFAHGKVDGGTVKWWMQQGDAARMAAIKGTESLADALAALSEFYGWIGNGPTVWANGPTFDISILEYAYAKTRLSVPWNYCRSRDCRTIKDLASHLNIDTAVSAGVAHNALDDAKSQARWVSRMWQGLLSAPAPAATTDADDIIG